MSQPIALVQPEPNAELIEGLERLMEQAKVGEIVGLAFVALRPEQSFWSNKIGRCSHLEMAGAITYALVDLIADHPILAK